MWPESPHLVLTADKQSDTGPGRTFRVRVAAESGLQWPPGGAVGQLLKVIQSFLRPHITWTHTNHKTVWQWIYNTYNVMEYMNIVANIELILLRGEFIVQYRTVLWKVKYWCQSSFFVVQTSFTYRSSTFKLQYTVIYNWKWLLTISLWIVTGNHQTC